MLPSQLRNCAHCGGKRMAVGLVVEVGAFLHLHSSRREGDRAKKKGPHSIALETHDPLPAAMNPPSFHSVPEQFHSMWT